MGWMRILLFPFRLIERRIEKFADEVHQHMDREDLIPDWED